MLAKTFLKFILCCVFRETWCIFHFPSEICILQFSEINISDRIFHSTCHKFSILYIPIHIPFCIKNPRYVLSHLHVCVCVCTYIEEWEGNIHWRRLEKRERAIYTKRGHRLLWWPTSIWWIAFDVLYLTFLQTL